MLWIDDGYRLLWAVWMATSVKEVQKLSAHAMKIVGNAGGPFAKRSKRGRGGNWKQPARQCSSLPPGFEKPKPAARGQLGGDKLPIQCFKMQGGRARRRELSERVRSTPTIRQ
jgi:hypothetical protein